MHFSDRSQKRQHYQGDYLIADRFTLSELFAGQGGRLSDAQRQILDGTTEALAALAEIVLRQDATSQSDGLLRIEARKHGSLGEVLDVRTHSNSSGLLVLGHTAPVQVIRSEEIQGMNGLHVHEKFANDAHGIGLAAPRCKLSLLDSLPCDNPALKSALAGLLGDVILRELPLKGPAAAQQYFVRDRNGYFTYASFPKKTFSAQISINLSEPRDVTCEICIAGGAAEIYQINVMDMSAKKLDLATARLLATRPLRESELFVLQSYLQIFSEWIR